MVLLSPYVPLHFPFSTKKEFFFFKRGKVSSGIPVFEIKESFLRLIANEPHPVLWESGVFGLRPIQALKVCSSVQTPVLQNLPLAYHTISFEHWLDFIAA